MENPCSVYGQLVQCNLQVAIASCPALGTTDKSLAPSLHPLRQRGKAMAQATLFPKPGYQYLKENNTTVRTDISRVISIRMHKTPNASR